MAAAEPLPPDWMEWTTDAGDPYYHNSVTNETQWERPAAEGQPAFPSFDNVFKYMPSPSELDAADLQPVAAAAGQDAERPSADGKLEPTDTANGEGISSFGITLEPDISKAEQEQCVAAARRARGAGIPPPDSMEGAAAWALGHAQLLFDVSTDDVSRRLRLALQPYPPPSDLAKQELLHRPDMYGPFWVATTAVLFLAATGNFARMLESDAEHAFRADYSLVGVAAAMIYGGLVAVPAAVKALVFFAGEEKEPMDLLHLTCVCGYALAPAIPASLLCLVSSAFLRWVFVLAGIACSLLFVRDHLLCDLDVRKPWLRNALLALPCATPVTVLLWYRLHFLAPSLSPSP